MKSASDHYNVGDKVKAVVTKIDAEKRRFNLGLKQSLLDKADASAVVADDEDEDEEKEDVDMGDADSADKAESKEESLPGFRLLASSKPVLDAADAESRLADACCGSCLTTICRSQQR